MFLITGGSSGIGKALALELACRGKQVLIVGRRQDLLAECADHSPLINFIKADITTCEGQETIVNAVDNSLEALVHNAGTIAPILPLEKMSESFWQEAFATNLFAPVFLTKRLLPKITGRVLHISSAYAHYPQAGLAAYCASKAALAMVTRCWQAEVTTPAFASVMPGIIDTNMQSVLRQSAVISTKKRQFYQYLYENNQLLTPALVAHFLSWLLLDTEASYFSSKEWDIYDKSHHEYWLRIPFNEPDWQLD